MPGKRGQRYVYGNKHMTEILEKIASTGRPEKLSNDYLVKTWLLKNRQYSAVLPLLRDMGFLDGSQVPTNRYALYQNSEKSGRALADGIREAYPELFKAYPKAHSLAKNKLTGYFREHSGAEQSVLDKIVGTFRTLCSKAAFDGPGNTQTHLGGSDDNKENQDHDAGVIPITMNIQIAIPPDATAEQYDLIFTSLKKNLLGK